MNPVIAYLITGEEVIGTVAHETDTHITFDGALNLFISPDEEGTPVFYFKKFSMYTTDFLCTFKKSDILTVFDNPIQPIRAHYKSSLEKFKMAHEKYTQMSVEQFQSSIDDDINEEEDDDELNADNITVH